MSTLVRKISKPRLLVAECIGGAILMVAAMLILPIGMISIDAALLLNPYVLGIVIIGMLLFGLVGYFIFIRPYLLYRKLPEILAETDGEFLYIHSKKEAKIPLSELSDAYVRFELPYLLQKEFLAELVIHLFSEEYGNVVLEIPGKGSYKMYFAAYAKKSADTLARFMENVE